MEQTLSVAGLTSRTKQEKFSMGYLGSCQVGLFVCLFAFPSV